MEKHPRKTRRQTGVLDPLINVLVLPYCIGVPNQNPTHLQGFKRAGPGVGVQMRSCRYCTILVRTMMFQYSRTRGQTPKRHQIPVKLLSRLEPLGTLVVVINASHVRLCVEIFMYDTYLLYLTTMSADRGSRLQLPTPSPPLHNASPFSVLGETHPLREYRD